jgi:hypothetical protein
MNFRTSWINKYTTNGLQLVLLLRWSVANAMTAARLSTSSAGKEDRRGGRGAGVSLGMGLHRGGELGRAWWSSTSVDGRACVARASQRQWRWTVLSSELGTILSAIAQQQWLDWRAWRWLTQWSSRLGRRRRQWWDGNGATGLQPSARLPACSELRQTAVLASSSGQRCCHEGGNGFRTRAVGIRRLLPWCRARHGLWSGRKHWHVGPTRQRFAA